MKKQLTFQIQNEFIGELVGELLGCYGIYKTKDQGGNDVFLCTHPDGRLVGFSTINKPQFETGIIGENISHAQRGFPGNDIIYYLKERPKPLFDDGFVLIRSYRSNEQYIVNVMYDRILYLDDSKNPSVRDVVLMDDRINIQIGSKWRSYSHEWELLVYFDSFKQPFSEFESIEDMGDWLKVTRRASEPFIKVNKATNQEIK